MARADQPELWRTVELETVDSTNLECMRRARKGERRPLWVVAKSQSKGKARRNRHWVSKPGNLYASVLVINNRPMKAGAILPFVASLAVVEAIASLTGAKFPDLAIKWPNDVLLNGKKLCGILLEAAQLQDNAQAIVIGCGINCKKMPELPMYPATSLAMEGYDVDPEILLPRLQRAMHRLLKKWMLGEGFPSFRSQWLGWAAGIGETITARFDDHEQSGVFRDIDDSGYLLLDTGNGVKKISAADIFFSAT